MIYTDKTLPTVFLESQRSILEKVPEYSSATLADIKQDKARNRAKYVIFDTPYTFKNKTYNIKSVVYYGSSAANYYYIKPKLGRKYIFDLSQRVLDRVPIMFSYAQIDDFVAIEQETGTEDRFGTPTVKLIPQQPSFIWDSKPYYEVSLSEFIFNNGSGTFLLKRIPSDGKYQAGKNVLDKLQQIPTWNALPETFKKRYINSIDSSNDKNYERGTELYYNIIGEASKFTTWKSYAFLASRQDSPIDVAQGINLSIPDAGFQTFNAGGVYNPYDNLYKTLWTNAFEAIHDNEVQFGSDPNLYQGTLGSNNKIRPDIEAVLNGGQPSKIVRNKSGLINRNGAISAITKDEISNNDSPNLKYKDEGPYGIVVKDISEVLSNATVTIGDISDAIDNIPKFPGQVGNPNVTSPVDDVYNPDSDDSEDLNQTPKSPFKEGTASVVPPNSAVSVVKGTMTFSGENKEGDSTWGVMTSPGSHFILDEKGNAKIKAAPPVDTDLTMGNVELGSEHGMRINVGTSLKIDVNQSGKHKEETNMSSSGSQSSSKIYYPAFSINVTNGGLDITCENGNISFLGKNIIMNATENLHLNGTRSLGLFSSFTGEKAGAFGVAKQLGSLFGFELPVGGGGEILIKGGKLNMDVTSLKDSASQRQSKTGAAKTSEVGSSNAVDATDSAADINLSTSGNVRISAGQKVRIEAQNWPINTSNPLTIPPVWQAQQLAAFELAANVLGPPLPPTIPAIQFSSWNGAIRSNVTGIGGITMGTQVGSISMYTGKVIPFDVAEAVPNNILLSSGLGSITQQAGLGIYQSSGLSLKAFTPTGALDIINGFKTGVYTGVKWEDIKGAKFDTTLGFDKTTKLGSAFEFDAGAFAKLDGAAWAKRGFGFASQNAPAMNINAEGAYNVNAGGAIGLNAGGAIGLNAGGAGSFAAGGAMNISAGAATSISAGGVTVVSSAVRVQLAAAGVYANGKDLLI
jgi:hypothetical protein